MLVFRSGLRRRDFMASVGSRVSCSSPLLARLLGVVVLVLVGAFVRFVVSPLCLAWDEFLFLALSDLFIWSFFYPLSPSLLCALRVFLALVELTGSLLSRYSVLTRLSLGFCVWGAFCFASCWCLAWLLGRFPLSSPVFPAFRFFARCFTRGVCGLCSAFCFAFRWVGPTCCPPAVAVSRLSLLFSLAFLSLSA